MGSRGMKFGGYQVQAIAVVWVNNWICMNTVQSSNGVMFLSLETLLGLPGECVFALENAPDKRVQVFSTASLARFLGQLVADMRLGSGEWTQLKDDAGKVELKILETGYDPKIRKLVHGHWISKYKEEGYEFYKDITPARFVVDIQLKHIYGHLQYAVSLKNTRKDKILIGLFRRKKDMTAWLNEHYPNGSVARVVKHDSVRRITP
jgi:hypothetical protein